MSDTPISDSTAHNVAELGMLCRRLERELTASNTIIRQQQLLDEESLRLQERIKRLEEALSLIRPTCEVVHHSKKHQHSLSQPCPVVELIKKAKKAKL
jgi:hypothetical protein